MDIFYLSDEELSLKGKGLLAILLLLPDDADKSVSSLKQYCSDGETAIKNSLIELEKLGYINRSRVRTDGKIGKVIIISKSTRRLEG